LPEERAIVQAGGIVGKWAPMFLPPLSRVILVLRKNPVQIAAFEILF